MPMATLTLHHNGRRTDIMFGGRTAVGDQAYVQLANNPGIYVVPVAGKVVGGELKNSVSLPDASGVLLRDMLQAAAAKTAVLAMGNPYVAQDFPAMQNYICAFSNATVSEISAVKALFGEIAIRGRLPVSIPNVARRGAGIDRQAYVAPGGSQHAQYQSSVH